MWCIQKMNPEYVTRMHDILDLYEEDHNPKKPVIAVDEKPKQLLEDSRKSLPMKPGKKEKYDYEYKRKGKVNIFVATDPKGGKRKVKVTDRRTKNDFALFMKEIVDFDYPHAEKIRCVVDNLNTHFPSSFYEAFEKAEADRILAKLEFHYTPKHASWLNAAEVEIGVMDHECTGRRIKNKEILRTELEAWSRMRNEQQKKIHWNFTKKDANRKLGKYYTNN